MSRMMAAICGLLLAIIAMTLIACGGSTKTVATTETIENSQTVGTSNLEGAAARRRFDGLNPSKECGYRGELSSPVIKTMSSVRVYYPNHRYMGMLMLRQSSFCPVSAGELFFKNLLPHTRIHIRLVRPGKYFKKEPYATTSSLSPTFTAMLANDPVSGCVLAEAWLVQGHSETKHFSTLCY